MTALTLAAVTAREAFLGIRLKLLLTFIICFGLMAGISLPLLKRSMDASYQNIERRDVVANMSRVLQAIEVNLAYLSNQSNDWAIWTEMYNYARKPDAAWADENLNTESLKGSDLSLVMVYDTNAQLLRMATRDRQGGELKIPSLPSGPYPALFQPDQANPSPRCGLMQSEAGVLLTCWTRITKSDTSGGTAGVLVIGRLLDETVKHRLQEQTGLPIAFLAPQQSPAGLTLWPGMLASGHIGSTDFFTSYEPSVYHLYYRLQDLRKQDIALITLDVSRDVHEQGQNLYQKAQVQVLLTALAVTAFLIVAVHLILTRRLRRFTHQLVTLAQESTWHSRIDVTGKDELGVLSSKVNTLLGLIESQVNSLKVLSLTDALTGLPNRREFDARLALEFGQQHRNRRPLALLMLDVDYFKRYNDHYGHPAGDVALKAVADVLRLSISRSSDLAARVGGEEFAVLLVDTDIAGAGALAERIRQNLRERCIPHAESLVAPHLSISIGVAMAGDETMAAFASRADQALYQAKHAGRDRVYFDTSLPTIAA